MLPLTKRAMSWHLRWMKADSAARAWLVRSRQLLPIEAEALDILTENLQEFNGTAMDLPRLLRGLQADQDVRQMLLRSIQADARKRYDDGSWHYPGDKAMELAIRTITAPRHHLDRDPFQQEEPLSDEPLAEAIERVINEQQLQILPLADAQTKQQIIFSLPRHRLSLSNLEKILGDIRRRIRLEQQAAVPMEPLPEFSWLLTAEEEARLTPTAQRIYQAVLHHRVDLSKIVPYDVKLKIAQFAEANINGVSDHLRSIKQVAGLLPGLPTAERLRELRSLQRLACGEHVPEDQRLAAAEAYLALDRQVRG